MPHANPYIIDVKELSKSFDKKQVVCNIDLQVKKGEIFGFLGPNGSGKTTTIRMICGLLKPDAGSGTCMGFDILKESESIKREVGYMTQHFSLYKELSIRENLEFIARLYQVQHAKKRVDETLDKLGFSQKRAKQLAGQLSGGWQQRLALAGAMLHDPQVLLLDEPTAGVDPQARREFWDEIHRLSEQGITTFVTTHYMDEAERCTRLAYLSFGHILSRGTIEEVIKNADLTVWVVTGETLSGLTQRLKNKPGIEQVIPFGKELHLIGHNPQLMEKSIALFQKNGYQWRQQKATLEDVFISLVAESKDNFA